MPPTVTRPELSTGQKHHIRLASRDWTGELRRLVDDRIGRFRAHLPLRARGPQVVIDPFAPHPEECQVAGHVFSPGRILDPDSELQAWVDGAEVGVGQDGSFAATVTLHAGWDEIHVRAKDLTKREGRGYVGTWCPGVVTPPPPPAEAPPAPRTQRIRMRLEDEDGQPFAHLPYELVVAGQQLSGITDDNGYLTAEVAAEATTGELTFWLDADKSGESYTWPLRIADIAQKPSGGGGRSVGRGAAGVYCGPLGGFVRAGQAQPDGTPLPPPRPIQRPARYGQVRAEVQRFLINPPLRGEGLTADLVLKDDQDAEVGRATVKLEQTSRGTLTEWVCITAADPAADPAPPAVEGRIIRVPNVKHTLELKVGEVLIGNRPVRFSGWDPAGPPTGIQKLERDAPGEVKLGGVVGGEFEEPARLGLRWMVDADEDDVLLPGAASADADAGLESAVARHGAELGTPDPVDLTEETAPVPLGWAALGIEGEPAEDPFPEEQAHPVVTYHEAPAADSPEAADFVHTPRPTRCVWHDAEGWATHPDQLVLVAKDGTADDDVKTLCGKHGVALAGAVRRDGQFLLQSREPLHLDELIALRDRIKGEACAEEVTYNLVSLAAAEDVSTVRVPDLLRLQAPDPGGQLQPGGVNPFELLALRHHFQIRSLPAQQLIERLRAQVTGTQPQVLLGVCDSGFIEAPIFGDPHPSISADFAPDRFPLGARRVGSGSSFPRVMGSQLPVTDASVREPSYYSSEGFGNRNFRAFGHGTLVLHAMAGGGTAFRGLDAAAPPLSATAPIGGLGGVPWALGVCPMAQVLPIRIAGRTGSSTFQEASGVRFAFLQTGVKVVNLSWGYLYTTAQGADARRGDKRIYQPALDQAKAVGGILVVAAGNDPVAISRNRPSFMGPTAARSATTDPIVVVTATSQTLLPGGLPPTALAMTFPSPWGSFETRELTGSHVGFGRDAVHGWRASYGPEASVSAPGDSILLRLSTATAPYGFNEVDYGSGTSFAAPMVSGLFGLMHLADQVVNPGAARGADFANKLIDLVEYTAHRDAPLFTQAEIGAKFSDVLGHGRIDCWAAVLSTLNGGPQQMATAPHQALSNLGGFVAPAAVKYYGFELDTRAYHARPLLVNADTGAVEELTDSHALDPAVAPDGRRVWSYLLRDGGGGDGVLPCTEHPGPDGWYSLQFSIARERLAAFTHLHLRRDGAPAPGASLVERGAAPAAIYYGLPLAPLLQHDTTGAAIAPFHVDLRHFIFKARTEDFDRRLRITFDRVELPPGCIEVGDYQLEGRVGAETTGQRTVRAVAGKPLYLDGPEWSKVVVADPAAELTLSLGGTGPAGGTIGPATLPLPTRTTPAQPGVLPYGLGPRRMTGAGNLTIFLRIDHEPVSDRRWRVELGEVRLTGTTAPGDYRFCIEAGAVRSAWSAAWRAANGGSTQPGSAVEAPWVPGRPLEVVFRWQDRGSLEHGSGIARPDLPARSATTSCTIQAGPYTATVRVASVAPPAT